MTARDAGSLVSGPLRVVGVGQACGPERLDAPRNG